MSLPGASLVQMGNTNMFLDDETTEEVAGEATTETAEPTEGAEVETPATEEAGM